MAKKGKIKKISARAISSGESTRRKCSRCEAEFAAEDKLRDESGDFFVSLFFLCCRLL